MGEYLSWLGIGLIALGTFILLFQAFGDSILWGLACLFFSPLLLVFIITRWPRTKAGLWLLATGMVIWVYCIMHY
jgi:hypothetical protein